MKEVLLYGTVYSWSAKEFIENVIKAESEDLVVRVNGDGGELKYGWGIVSKLSGLENVKLINDGEANSMFAFAFCYGKDNEAADYATFMFHRAAYPSWYEQDPALFTEADKQDLIDKNKKLRQAFEAKVNAEKFKEVTGVSVDELFSLKSRIDVTLDAKQAKKVGLIDRIIQVTPKRREEITALKERIEAKANPPRIAADNQTIPLPMNKEKLLAEHPALYNEIFALGKTAGVTEERDRVEAIMVFNDVDPKACAEAIASGKPLTSKQMAEFSLKAVTAGRKKDLKDDSAGEATTGEAADTSAEAENKELRAFAEKVKKQTAFFSETK